MSRNIVLITLDSLRADHCSFMGYERPTTPTLDALASEGIVFENAIAAGVPTIASMTSVMTGEFATASPEIGFDREQRKQVTSRRKIAEVLSDAGYTTGAVSPNPPASSYFGFDEGFDWFEDFLHKDRGVVERGWNRILARSIEGGSLATYLRLARNVVSREEVLRPWNDYYDLILRWRDQLEEPYFLWVLLLEPHHPWLPPTEHRRWSSRSDVLRSFKLYWDMLNSGWAPDYTPEQHRRLINLYDDSISHGDQFIERLRTDLRQDDPVFIIHADHGEEFGEHGRYGHQPHLYENLVHVPLVISNLDRTETVSRPASLRALPSTIADIADVPHSFSLPSLLSGSERPWSVSKVFPGGNRRAAIRSRRFKYHREDSRTALFDLQLDPDEQVDSRKDRQGIAELLRGIADHDTAVELEKRAIDAGSEMVVREAEL